MRKRFHQLGRWLRSRGLFLWQHLPHHSKPSQENLGLAGEKAAARFLRKQGYRIIAHSHRQRLGEIDLIALDGNCIVFVEVKTWRSNSEADPSEAVDRRKQERITRAALIYLKSKKLLEQPARFDVISVVWPSGQDRQPKFRHFKHAFEAVGSGQMYR